MPTDPNNPEVLLSVRSDAEAGVIVGVLADHDIEALVIGGSTAGFRAEAPGDVQILVKHANVQQAREALAESQATVDWQNVDTSETSETPSDEDEFIGDDCRVSNSTYVFWCIVLLVNVAGLLCVWVAQREIHLLVLAVLGLIFAFLFFRRRRSP